MELIARNLRRSPPPSATLEREEYAKRDKDMLWYLLRGSIWETWTRCVGLRLSVFRRSCVLVLDRNSKASYLVLYTSRSSGCLVPWRETGSLSSTSIIIVSPYISQKRESSNSFHRHRSLVFLTNPGCILVFVSCSVVMISYLHLGLMCIFVFTSQPTNFGAALAVAHI